MRSEFYTVVDDERGRLEIEFVARMAFLHAAFRRPVDAMRAARRLFPDVKRILRALGYRLVHVVIPEGDAKLRRFEELFGFREVKRHGGFVLMAQEC